MVVFRGLPQDEGGKRQIRADMFYRRGSPSQGAMDAEVRLHEQWPEVLEGKQIQLESLGAARVREGARDLVPVGQEEVDVLPVFEDPPGQPGPDESSSAGDQDLHFLRRFESYAKAKPGHRELQVHPLSGADRDRLP